MYLFADATMIGLEQNAIKNHVICAVPSMASAKMELVYVAKDGTEDTAHYVRKRANYKEKCDPLFQSISHHR